MTSEREILRQQIRAEARRMAATIREIEEETPGLFGEAAAVIRQQAAGDDVALTELMSAIVFVRLTILKHLGAPGRSDA